MNWQIDRDKEMSQARDHNNTPRDWKEMDKDQEVNQTQKTINRRGWKERR